MIDSAPIVQLSDVWKTYSGKWGRPAKHALEAVAFSIGSGEAVGFIGHNGAGKSSTIRLILGLQECSKGCISLKGLPPSDPNSRKGVSYLPENPYLYDYLTPLELLEMGVKMHQVQVPNVKEHCMNWLAKFGLKDAARRQIKTFSKGMMQRTALAHALCVEPDLLILDEPLSGLDPIGRKEVVEILEEYRNRGRTLFFSSHVLYDVERLADRFIFIHKGKIRAICATHDAISQESQYEMVVESLEPVAGFRPLSARLWVKDIAIDDLEYELASLRGLASVQLYSVKTKQTLEQAYLKFVAQADVDDHSTAN